VLRVTILGSGTSHGVPMIGCECAVCKSLDPHNRPRRDLSVRLSGQTWIWPCRKEPESASAGLRVNSESCARPEFSAMVINSPTLGRSSIEKLMSCRASLASVPFPKDLQTFSLPPRRLFPWDMATIDVIIRQEGDYYYAVLKDERYPTLDWPTGKTIRICRSPNLLGPYSEPGPPISPNFREAPTLIPSPNGKAWYLYYEQYPGVAYGLSVAASLEGPWFQAAGGQQPSLDKYHLPPKVRHGSMLAITAKQYDALVVAFGKTASN